LLRPEEWKRDTRFGTWNVRSLYKAGSLTAAVREIARYELDLVGVQEVRWDWRAREEQGIIMFSMEVNK